MPIKGFSLDNTLCSQVEKRAKAEKRSFSFIVRRALEREMATEYLTPPVTPVRVFQPAAEDELIETKDVARLLKLNPETVRRRARTIGDPIRLARSRVGKQKPMTFHLSKIRQIDRRAA